MNAVLVLKKARLDGEPDPVFSEHIAEFAHAYGNTFGMNKFHPITKENSEEACLTEDHDNITNNFIGHHVGNFDGIHAIIRPIKNATHNDRPLIHWCLVQREPGLKTSLTSATKDIAHAAHAAGYSLSFQPNDFTHYYPSAEGGLQTQVARTRLFDKWMERLQSFSPVEKRLVLRKEESLEKGFVSDIFAKVGRGLHGLFRPSSPKTSPPAVAPPKPSVSDIAPKPVATTQTPVATTQAPVTEQSSNIFALNKDKWNARFERFGHTGGWDTIKDTNDFGRKLEHLDAMTRSNAEPIASLLSQGKLDKPEGISADHIMAHHDIMAMFHRFNHDQVTNEGDPTYDQFDPQEYRGMARSKFASDSIGQLGPGFDWRSKAAPKADGPPEGDIFFHGTPSADFDGIHHDPGTLSMGVLAGRGFYVAHDPADAATYAHGSGDWISKAPWDHKLAPTIHRYELPKDLKIAEIGKTYSNGEKETFTQPELQRMTSYLTDIHFFHGGSGTRAQIYAKFLREIGTNYAGLSLQGRLRNVIHDIIYEATPVKSDHLGDFQWYDLRDQIGNNLVSNTLMSAGYDASRVNDSGTNKGAYISVHPSAVHRIIYHGSETASPDSWRHRSSLSRLMKPVIDEELSQNDWRLKDQLERDAHAKQFPESYRLHEEAAARRMAKAMSERLRHKQVEKALVFRTSDDDDLLKGRGAEARINPSSHGIEAGHSIHDPMMLKFKATHDSLEKFSSSLEDRPAKPFFGRLIPAGEFVHLGYFGPKGMTKLTVSPTDHDTNPELPTKMAINSLLTPGAPVAHPKVLYLKIAHDAPERVTKEHEKEIFQGLWDAGYRGRNMTYMTYPDVQSTAAKYAHLRAARGQPPRKITAQRDHLFAPVRQRWADFVDGKNGEQNSPEPESHLQRSMNKGIDNFFYMAVDPVTLGAVATAYAGYRAYRKLKPKLVEGIKRFKEMQGEQKAPPEEKVAKKSISSEPSRPLIFRSSL